jgi:hypothetical protein
MIMVLDANIVIALFAELSYSASAKAAVAKARSAIAPDLGDECPVATGDGRTHASRPLPENLGEGPDPV